MKNYIDSLIEKAFSDGYDYALEEVLFSKNHDDKNHHKLHIDELDSHRGLGRSIVLGGPSPAGAIGGYFGKRKAEELDRQGKSDRDIVEGASKHGRNIGAAAGAGFGALGAGAGLLIHHKGSKFLGKVAEKNGNTELKNAISMGRKHGRAMIVGAGLGGAAVLTGFGALGGYLGSKKNAEERLQRRRNIENGYYGD